MLIFFFNFYISVEILSARGTVPDGSSNNLMRLMMFQVQSLVFLEES